MLIGHLFRSLRTQKCKKKFLSFHAAQRTVGGAPPPLSQKFARHPAGKKTGEAIFWDFWAKSPPGLLNKHPTEKNFSPPGGGAGEKIFGRRRRPENFFEDTPRC